MYISSETRLFIREHSTDDVRTLALQSKKYPDVDVAFIEMLTEEFFNSHFIEEDN